MEINQRTNAIKGLAIIRMTIDHIGYYLFPSFPFLRLVGRIAFPCFLYTTVGRESDEGFPGIVDGHAYHHAHQPR
ncbi:trax [Trichococcus palustris]|uniref:Trax n=1 Tax=Trichococcus palustris TaxID=140314 RepID=A0A143YNL3_9LACT|nr:TraX family protein [Trichococcus palustris]CZQ95114.1 trax [Trichococcus palustris]SFK92725.1 TraX protein [Trichococcus palustris]